MRASVPATRWIAVHSPASASAGSGRLGAVVTTVATGLRRAVAAPVRPVRAARDVLASAGVRRPRAMRGTRTEHPFDAPVLRTGRLVLRPHRLSAPDLDDWFALQSEASVREFLPWPERDRRHSDRHLRDRTRHTRLWQADDFLALAVERDGRVIGDVSLHLRRVERAERSVEIGWVLHPAFGGSGYATEAARATIGFAFDEVGAREVTAVTDAGNLRSVAMARRLGFVERAEAGNPARAAGGRPGELTFVLTRAACSAGRGDLAA